MAETDSATEQVSPPPVSQDRAAGGSGTLARAAPQTLGTLDTGAEEV